MVSIAVLQGTSFSVLHLQKFAQQLQNQLMVPPFIIELINSLYHVLDNMSSSCTQKQVHIQTAAIIITITILCLLL